MRKMLSVIAICLCILIPAISFAQEVFGWQGDVAFFASDNGKLGLLNRAGDILSEPVYDGGVLFGPGSNGLACVTLGNKVGAINRNGDLVIPLTEGRDLQFEWDGMSLEPYADIYKISHADGSLSYFSAEGKWLGNRSWLSSYGFVGASAMVKSEEGWNLLSNSGELLLDKWYDTAYSDDKGGIFWDGDVRIVTDENGQVHSLAVYENDDLIMKRWWDPASGRYHELPHEWQNAKLCAADLMIYQQNELWGLAKRNGTILSGAEWDAISTNGLDSSSAPLVVEKDNYYGLISAEGKILVQPQWLWMEDAGNGVFLALYKGSDGYDRYCTMNQSGQIIEQLPEGIWIDSLNRSDYNEYDCYLAAGQKSWCVLSPTGHIIFMANGEKVRGCGVVALDDGSAVIRFTKDGRPAYVRDGQPAISNPQWVEFADFIDDAYFNVIGNDRNYHYIGLYGQPDICIPAEAGTPGSSVRINDKYYIHMAKIDANGKIIRNWANEDGQLLYPY